MAEKTVTIQNRHGLHVRPATQLAELAGKFKSPVTIVKDGQEVSARSIIELLTLAAAHGTELRIKAEGPDAAEAVDAIQKLIDGRFGLE
ncbi:MAG: HPr family phosphocarrier protein [Planctomycetes bacterium]|nr:HPr family phosphocarrier protein [Planctomycetota bacterium]